MIFWAKPGDGGISVHGLRAQINEKIGNSIGETVKCEAKKSLKPRFLHATARRHEGEGPIENLPPLTVNSVNEK